jgi:hypothetical protein
MSTSMAMCLQALGHDVTEDEVNRVMGARPMKGASWEQALACAQHYGCRATLTMPSTVKQLREWTDAGSAVMIAWNPEGRDWSHASTVFDVTDELPSPVPAHCTVISDKGSEGPWVWVADPNIPNPEKTVRICSQDDFYSKWFEKWPDYLVRRPACAIEREITPQGRQVMASAKRVAEKFLQAGFSDHVIYHVDDKGNVWAPDGRTGKPIVGRPWSGTIPAGVYSGLQTERMHINWKADVSATYNVREWKEYYALWAEYLELYGRGWERQAPLVLSAGAKFKNGFPPKNLRRDLGYAQPPGLHKTDLKSAVAKLRAERERQSLVSPEDLALFQKMWRGKSEHYAETLWQSHNDAVKQWLWLGWIEQTSRQRTNRDNQYRERTQVYGWDNFYVLTKEGQKALQMSAEDLVGYKPRLVPKKPEAPKAPEPAPAAPSGGSDPKLKAKRLEVLGLVLNKYPDDSFLQGMRKLIENDRPLSDNQLSAIRRKLYMSRMKPEADHFRTAAHVEAVRKAMDKMARAKRKNKPQSMKDKMKIDTTPEKLRDPAARALAERGSGGGGRHHTRDRDVEKGHSRKDKHKKDWRDKEGASNRWVDMDGRSFDVGSRVEYWPDPRARSWSAPVVGFDRKHLLVGDPTHPVKIPLNEVSKHLRLKRGSYSGNPDGKPIYPNQIDHGTDTEPLAGGHDVMRRLQNKLIHEQGDVVPQRPESPKVARYSFDRQSLREAAARVASAWTARQENN